MFPLAKSLRATAPFSAFPGPPPRRSPTSCPQGTALPAAPAQAGRGVPGDRVPPSAQRPRGSPFAYLCRWRQDGEAGEVSAGCLRGFPLPRHPRAVRACRGPGRRAAGLPRWGRLRAGGVPALPGGGSQGRESRQQPAPEGRRPLCSPDAPPGAAAPTTAPASWWPGKPAWQPEASGEGGGLVRQRSVKSLQAGKLLPRWGLHRPHLPS